MMLRFGWLALALALLAACSDPGPRDRSLARSSETFPVHPDVYATRENDPGARRFAVPSNVGLKVDELAPLYPANAHLVIRCSDLASLHQHARGRLAQLATLLPEWGLPELPPGTLLRVHAAVPEGVVIDRLHPFAFVRTDGGWVALLPIRETFPDSDSIRRVEGRYCVSGSPEAVAAYSHGGRTGYCLPGDISITAHAEAIPDLGRRLTDAAARLKIALPGIGDLPGNAFEGLDRIDLSLHCREATVRAELRVVPNAERARTLASMIGALDARRGGALGKLPANEALTLAAGCDVASLLTMATQLGAPLLDKSKPDRLAMLEKALAMLGDDAAVCLRLDRESNPTLLLVAELTAPDRRAVAAFLGSDDWPAMLAQLGGTGHTLAYDPIHLDHSEIEVGTVAGSPAPATLDEARTSGVWGATFARLFAHPGRFHLALSGNRLCVTVGEDAQSAMESLLDRIHGRIEDAAAQSNGLRVRALLEGSLDAAALFSLARPDVLVEARNRLPVRFALASEGDALRLTMRVPLERIVRQWTTRDAAAAAPPESDSPSRD